MNRERWAVLFQCIAEVFSFLIFPIVSMLRLFIPLDKVNNHDSQKPTIIIIEQWFVQTVSHVFLKSYLEKRNFKVYMFNFNPVHGGFDDGAYHLRKFINKQKIKDCILVGISMGAVTSYVYAQRFGGWKKVKKIVSLGGPFRGTPWALVFSFLKNGKQILPQSNFIEELQKEKLQFPDRVFCIIAKSDELVPRWSSILAKVRSKEVPIVGHNNLHIWSKDAWELVAREAMHM